MSLLGRLMGDDRPALIGPGRVVLVVGPSGAGKDTLIDLARKTCAGDVEIAFQRRVVTRPSSSAEDHDTLSAAAFDRAERDGAFALRWEAHGHKYGIPATMDDDVRAGRTVVLNISRLMIDHARVRYGRVCVVLITAPPAELAARLAARGRSSDGDAGARLGRVVLRDEDLRADVTIENVGDPKFGARKLLDAIYDRTHTPTL